MQKRRGKYYHHPGLEIRYPDTGLEPAAIFLSAVIGDVSPDDAGNPSNTPVPEPDLDTVRVK